MSHPTTRAAPLLALAATLACAAPRAHAAAPPEPPRAPPPGADVRVPVPPPPPEWAGGQRRTLTASGEGRAFAEPDLAVLSVGAESLAKGLSDATRDADGRVRRVVEALRAAGVEQRDIRTTRYDVALERPYDPQTGRPGEISGYRVIHELRVSIRGGDRARAGKALEGALKAGANVVHSIAFQREDDAPERARALGAAVEAARRKAEVMAKAAGVRLGDVLEVREGGGGAPPPVPMYRAMKAEADAGAPLQTGELEYAAAAEVTFSIR